MNRFFFIDGHSIIFRSFFAFIRNPLRNSKGMNTSAVFGFLSMLVKLNKKFAPQYMAIAFDTGGETFRDRQFKDYKATRPPVPDELPPQIPIIQQLSRIMGIHCLEKEDYEADDLLATLALRFKAEGEVYIVTSDKDLLQMVGGRVFVYDPYKDVVYDRDKVRERFGVDPEQVVDILALAGDASDNVPGIAGIGEKRAAEIITKYKSAEQAAEQDGRLKGHEDELLLYKKLLTVVTDVDLKVRAEDLRLHEIRYDQLLPILKELDFYSLIKELTPRQEEKVSYQPLGAPNQLKAKDRIGICFDRDLLGGSFYVSTGPKTSYQLDENQTQALKPMLENTVLEKAGFDLKGTLKELWPRGLTLCQPVFDLGVAAWLVDPNRKSHRPADLALQYLNQVVAADSPYSSADLARQLLPALRKKLDELDLSTLFHTIEMELLFVLADMERRGIKLDLACLKGLNAELDKMLAHSESVIYRKAGHEFNLNSPKQLSQVLFEELKLEPRRKRKTHYSTDALVLSELAQIHELPAEMLKYRELAKLKSTYVDPLQALAVNARLHTTFNQTGTATGRLSSSNPNLQNIPIRTDLGKRIREGFVTEEGFKLISADYSQIELRILAALSGDKKLIDAFACGEDIHNQTAANIFNVKPDVVTSYQRRVAKVVNYGIIYGMSQHGLSQELVISHQEAQAFIDNHKAIYPQVQAWIDQAIASASEKGYAETLYKRKRPMPEIASRNRSQAEFAMRTAVNTPIQGTAADVIKIAMIRIYKLLHQRKFHGGLLLQIHDELLFEIEESRIDEAKALIKETMEHVVDLKVPIEVSVGVGDNWAQAH